MAFGRGRDAPDQRQVDFGHCRLHPAEAGTLRTQLLLDEGVGKSLFCLLVGDALAIQVMGHFVNQNVIQIKLTQVVKGVAGAEMEWVGAKENTGIPIHAIASQAAGPRFLLFAGSRQQEDRSQTLA